MFLFPEMWARMNARVSRKELKEFDCPRQLASTKGLGALFTVAAAFSFASMLY